MRTITLQSATPWLTAAFPAIGAKAAVVPSKAAIVPTIAAAWGKLPGSVAADFASAQVVLGRSAVRTRGESGFGAARPMYDAHDQLTLLIPNNGGEVRGPIPWREPVTT